ncbi:methyltransferase domain-containing protein [Rhizobium herbae]|uniref:Methyltransferase domain-containing protein n=1 Tax=Rhizobium herbae TaxID=508661 RepID=A0ABS7H3S3_9HYPH|nr:class I SAM-dependent methyltransferase [Rhizobium herbae]MBW9061887.1 methyltransferase domain-containing protein [Rhizobium herbae]
MSRSTTVSTLPGRILTSTAGWRKSPAVCFDLGCGTGLLTVRLAALGHHVTGADPAPAMLDIARRRPGGETVRWINGDIYAVGSEERFDLVLMTGHVFQVFLDDDQVLAVVSSVRRHLENGGRLVFESRNPLARAWERWTPDHSFRTIAHPRLGTVETWHEVIDVRAGQVSFRTYTRIGGRNERAISQSTLAFRSHAEIRRLLHKAGFVDVSLLGGWDGLLFSAGSSEIIAIAR